MANVFNTSLSLVLHSTSRPPWMCLNSPDSWLSRTLSLSYPSVWPPINTQGVFIWLSQFSVPKKTAFSQPKLLFHEVLPLSKGYGRLIVLFKSFHLVFYSKALRVVIPNLEVLISFPGFIAQNINFIKLRSVYLYSKLGVADSSSHIRPFSASASHSTT